MSLANILEIARTALTAQQRAMGTLAHNIANASTPGYTRQEVTLRPNTPLSTPAGAMGTGVSLAEARRLRNAFLDESFRRESGLLGEFAATRDLLSQVEGALAEPGDAGLAEAFGAFFDAWSDLASNPGADSASHRFLTRQAGEALVARFRSVDASLERTAESAQTLLADRVATANDLLAQITTLNRRLVELHGRGGAPDLEDQRDLAIDKLAKLVAVRTVRQEDGAVMVIAGSTVVADAARHVTLGVVPAGAGWGVGLDGATEPVDLGPGEIRAITAFTGTTLPQVQQQLDDLAAAVVSAVNARHQAGVVTGSTPPVTGVPFFAPAGTTAGTIALSDEVAGSIDQIVTGATGQAGDGTIALQIAQLRYEAVGSLGGRSLPDFHTGIVTFVATQKQAADRGAEAQDTVTASLDLRRTAEHGVNTDEELVEMIRAQQAYGAAARIVSTANAMLEDLLRIL